MEKICSNCYSLSNRTYLKIPLDLLLGIVFLALGIIRISFGILDSSILSLLLTITLLIAGIVYLKSYFVNSNKCPHCADGVMLDIDSPEADEIIHEPKYDNRYKLCSSCYAVSKLAITKKYNKYWSLGLFLVGLFGVTIFIVTGINSLPELIDTIGFIICLLAGFYGLYTNLIISTNCNACGAKNSIISINTAQAQELIKEHNILIPDELNQESSPQST